MDFLKRMFGEFYDKSLLLNILSSITLPKFSSMREASHHPESFTKYFRQILIFM